MQFNHNAGISHDLLQSDKEKGDSQEQHYRVEINWNQLFVVFNVVLVENQSAVEEAISKQLQAQQRNLVDGE